MGKPLDQLHPDRLFEAIEAIYRANEELSASGGLRVYPPSLMGTPLQPEPFCEFTPFEIEEATRFLMRMGLIVRDDEEPRSEDRRCA